MTEWKSPEIEDVYTPEEILAIHRLLGWTTYIASSAHCERMTGAHQKACDARYLEYVKDLPEPRSRTSPRPA
jgi:hypothetical protein